MKKQWTDPELKSLTPRPQLKIVGWASLGKAVCFHLFRENGQSLCTNWARSGISVRAVVPDGCRRCKECVKRVPANLKREVQGFSYAEN